FIIAAAITVSRASRREMGFVSLLSTVLPAAVGLISVIPAGGFSIEHPAWILFNGAVMMKAVSSAMVSPKRCPPERPSRTIRPT
ncbi:hypothetical protein AB9F39_37525, partial [Rhizobium leguminosarum]